MLLPPELLALVVSFLDVSDRKTVRLGSRLLNDLASPDLFRSVHLFYTLADFERLSNIAEHGTFRLQVRRIVYAPSRYAPRMTLDQWQHHYNRNRFQRMNAAVWLRRPYEEYVKLWQEQEAISERGIDSLTWLRALQRLENLEEIQLLLREAEKPGYGILQRLSRRTFCPPDEDPRPLGRGPSDDERDLFTPLRLRMEGVGYLFFPRLIEVGVQPLLSIGLTLLRKLHLEIIDSRQATGTRDEWVRARQAMCAYIQSAPQLEDVAISFRPSPVGLLGFQQLFPQDVVWPALTRVVLAGFIGFGGLHNFARRHASLDYICVSIGPVGVGPFPSLIEAWLSAEWRAGDVDVRIVENESTRARLALDNLVTVP